MHTLGVVDGAADLAWFTLQYRIVHCATVRSEVTHRASQPAPESISEKPAHNIGE